MSSPSFMRPAHAPPRPPPDEAAQRSPARSLALHEATTTHVVPHSCKERMSSPSFMPRPAHAPPRPPLDEAAQRPPARSLALHEATTTPVVPHSCKERMSSPSFMRPAHAD